MKALAEKLSSKDTLTRSRQGTNHKQVPVKKSVPAFSGSIPLIQRKALCPCDGGCPRCTNEGIIQPKLTIGQPNDKYEQEADRIAEQIMRMPEPVCPECLEEEDERIQPKQIQYLTPLVPANIESGISALKGRGQPLPGTVKNFFEPRFGHDFSQVRIHNDSQANEAAGALNAHAFTSAENIVFNRGEYTPDKKGMNLLAHELAHVVQQSKISTSPLIQCRYRLEELMRRRGSALSNMVELDPETYFYAGSLANRNNRRALVIGGIHGNEVASAELGRNIQYRLQNSIIQPYFHTVIIPEANPGSGRGAGTRAAGTSVSDLNRQFGTGYRSHNPIAAHITDIVNEFDPERILSIHCASPGHAGIYLDPIHNRVIPGSTLTGWQLDRASYPAVGNEGQRETAFAGDPRNFAAMWLTEEMIMTVPESVRAGNIVRTGYPRNQFPGITNYPSFYNMIYPAQSSVGTRGNPDIRASLGQWGSAQGRTVITVELPGNNAPPGVQGQFIDAIERFLTMY